MAPKTTLNAKNLEALGPQRLAELLMEISTGSAAHKRRLRIELAGSQGGAEMARQLRQRLVSIARARTAINWRRVRTLKAELETHRTTIAGPLAAEDPTEAFELIWQFLAMAEPIFERSDDGSGTLMESFHQACADAGVIAQAARISGDVLADKIFAALQNNGYGQYDRLVAAMAGALGRDGLEQLRSLLVQWSEEPQEKPAGRDREIIGRAGNGPLYADDIFVTDRDLTVRVALEDIADALGDVDAYIAQQTADARRAPMVAANIANRLLVAGRAAEALEALDAARPRDPAGVAFAWQLARVAALEALGRGAEAQAYRWSCFEQTLNAGHLRAFLKRLPDFDDMETEERAFGHAQAFPDIHKALVFFLDWPALDEAARLIRVRHGDLDGNLYEVLTTAAEALREKHPLAATLALRAMIGFTLDHARSSRYSHAARHLADCASLGRRIDDFGALPAHDAYVGDLRMRHGKKHGFWSRVD